MPSSSGRKASQPALDPAELTINPPELAAEPAGLASWALTVALEA
jgi:hypothetical protein